MAELNLPVEEMADHSEEEDSAAEEEDMSEEPSNVEDSVSEDNGAPTMQGSGAEHWQYDSRYDKYWQHWHSMMGWYQQHRKAPAQVQAVWQHVMQNGCAPMEPCDTRKDQYRRRRPSWERRSASHSKDSLNSNAKRRRRTKRKKHKKKHSRKNVVKHSDTDTMDTTSETGNNEVPEISPEFREFMAVTARHREERKRQREEEARRAALEDDYIEADKLGLPKYGRTTTEAPAQQPGQQRKAEMKRLYGTRAPVIHGLETAMQMEFDASCDLKQPKLWPTIPLKL
ncbi:GEMIN8 [Branchiostoma lanceolatum]|uniref:GEMIN8 protein n=1 Tax=Branchiostoma lanceolatum TaxID=7740 RepID=A0A8S4MPU5_BRALA|nr:GEMIN8 [Branchiostoma lanceolatum]